MRKAQITTTINLSVLAIVLVTGIGCGSKKDTVDTDITPATEDAVTEAPLALDPENARAKVKPPELAVASEGSDMRVPELRITLDQADFVQIARCDGDYELMTPSGEPIDAVRNMATGTDQMRWAWQEALANTGVCKLLGNRITRSTFQDLTAKTGTHIYVLNPCVTQEHSTTGKEQCNYQLVVSERIDYTSTLSDNFVDIAMVLAQREGMLASHFNKLIFLASEIKRIQSKCEQQYNQKEAVRRFFRGITSIASWTVGTAVGVYVMGPGGINGGDIPHKFARNLFDQFFQQKEFSCPGAENLSQQAMTTLGYIDTAVEAVDLARQDMAKMDEEYRGMDMEILTKNTGESTDED